MDETIKELKEALQDTLYLLTEEVPIRTFENYNECNGIDEGVLRAYKMITDAIKVLDKHLTEEEKIQSSLFFLT